MSIIGRLFGFGGDPTPPKPTPAAPRIGDAESVGLGREEAARTRRKKGFDDTILTAASGLGDVGGDKTAPVAQVQRTSLLGGGA